MKTRILSLATLLAAGVLVLSGCNKTENNTEEENTGMANPASVYCEEQGGILQIELDDEGNQYGICMFEDGSYCEEWSYYKGECQPGEIIYNTVSEDEISGEEIINEEETVVEEENINEEENAVEEENVNEEENVVEENIENPENIEE